MGDTVVNDVTSPDSENEICQIDGESQRVTRNSTKMHKTTDEELVWGPNDTDTDTDNSLF